MMRRFFGEKCYDPKRKSLYYLWKSELDSRFIRVNVTGSGIGTVWVLASDLQPSPDFRHPPLEGERKRYVEQVKENLDGVYDLTLEEWEDGFRKDSDIDRNIAEWWFLSGRFRSIKESLILSHEEKKSLFMMMMSIMNNGKVFAAENVTYHGQVEKGKSMLIERFTQADGAGTAS